MKGLTLSQIRSVVENTCRAVDIRAVAFKAESGWKCAVAVIRLTYRSAEKVRQDHQALIHRLGEVGNDSVKVMFGNLPVNQLDSVIMQLSNNELTMGTDSVSLESKGNDLWVEKLADYANLSQDEPDAPYPCHEVMLYSDETPQRMLEHAGVTAHSLGLQSLNDLQSWLGASVMGHNVGAVLVIPVYAKIDHPFHFTGGSVQARFSAHKWLFDRCNKTGVLRPGYNTSPVARKELKVSELGYSDDIVTGLLSETFPLDPLRTDSLVEFQFTDTALGILAEADRHVSQMLSPSRAPLYEAFSHFDGGKNLDDYLLDPKGKEAEAQFNSAVSWLLQLSGFSVLNLSLLPAAEHLRVEGKEEGACDMLAALESGQKSSVLVIDCTTAVPRPDKQARIRLTSEKTRELAGELFRALQVTVRPVIVVSKDVPELQNPQYRNPDDYVLGKPQLRELLELVRAGNRDQAVMTLCRWLSLPYPKSTV